MEQLPKIVGQRLQAVSPGAHPDANLLAAFAEKSLLVREQARVLDHLAGCAACREMVAQAQPEEALQSGVAGTSSPRSWLQGTAVRWAALAACVVVVGAVVISRSHLLQRSPMAKVTTSAPVEVAKVEVAKNEEQPAPSAPLPQVLKGKESENKLALSKTAPVVGTRRDEVAELDKQQLAATLPNVSGESRKLDTDKEVLQTYHGANLPAGNALGVGQAAAAPVSSPMVDETKANKKEFSAGKAMKVPMSTNESVQVEAASVAPPPPPPAAKAAADSGLADRQKASSQSEESSAFYKPKDGYVGTGGAAVGSL